jgi:hypothetical protein
MCGTIKRTLKQETLKSLKLIFYKIVAVPILNCSCENQRISLLEERRIK